MKINGFNQVFKEEFKEERLEKQGGETLQSQQIDESKLMSEQVLEEKKKDRFEQRILENPNLLQSTSNFSFWERTFSFRFPKPGIDLYPVIAIIQILLLIYMILFFPSMTSGSDINSILKYNQIPASMVGALLAHIILLVIERYIALRNPVIGEEEQQQQLRVEEEQRERRKTLSRKPEDDTNQQPAAKPEDGSYQQFQKQWKLQFIFKFVLQIVVLFLVYWFVFIHLAKPFKNQVKSQTVDNASIAETINYNINSPTICFFLLYCIYFYVSALQLKYGYKELKLRNTFLQYHTQLSYIFAKSYYSIPFLFELKVLMDWTFLKTSLDVFQWFTLEDINGLMFFAKIQGQNYLARPLGTKIAAIMKCGMGCTLVTFILICIFGPLILFSTLNPSQQLNLVSGGQVTISLVNKNTGLTVPLYSSNQMYGVQNTLSQGEMLQQFQVSSMSNAIIDEAPKTGALQKCQVLSFSNQNWEVSPPLFTYLNEQLEQQLNGTQNYTFIFNVTYYFTRQNEVSVPKVGSFQYPGNQLLSMYEGNNATALPNSVLQAIHNAMSNCVTTPTLLPYFYLDTIQLFAENDGTTFKPKPIVPVPNSVSNVTMGLYCDDGVSVASSGSSWWNFTYSGVSPNSQEASGLMFFVVSDKFSTLTLGFSIITIYTSVILLIGGFIRSLFSGQVWMLEFTYMLKPDDLLLICDAISIASENLLYFELIDILRSPEIVKVMTGSWSETFKKRYIQEQVEIERRKLKYD